jgi:hypothetical protein
MEFSVSSKSKPEKQNTQSNKKKSLPLSRQGFFAFEG